MQIPTIDSANGISSNPVANGEITKETFLQLLSTQLQYQDPLEPASDVEFIQQMATFAQLEQQQITNEHMQILNLYEGSINNSNALNIVGKDVKIHDNLVNHTQGQSHTVNYEGVDEAARVRIRVLNEDGREVYKTSIVGSSDGEHEFTWFGVDNAGQDVASGDYKIEIKLEDAEGELYDSPVYQRQKVNGISYENGSIMVLVGEKRIPIENVVEVYGAGTSSAGGPEGGFKQAPGKTGTNPLSASSNLVSSFSRGTMPYQPLAPQPHINSNFPFRVIAGGR